MTTTKTESFEEKPIISKFERIENRSAKDAQKAIVTVLYDQHKAIIKLRNSNKKLWSEIQQCKITRDSNQENASTSQIIMKEIWDNKEDEFWDTY